MITKVSITGWLSDKCMRLPAKPKRSKRITALLLLLLGSANAFAQTSFIQAPPVINGNSALSRGPNGSVDFQRTAAIYLGSEVVGLPPGAPITSLGFSLLTPAAAPATGNIKLYMVNTTDATYNRTSTWSTIISSPTPMQLVYDGPLTIPATAGYYNVTLQTPFAYTGGNFYLAYEWSATTKSATSATYHTNTAITGGVITATGTSLPAILTTSSPHRPVLQLGFTTPANDLNVAAVYNLGKLPMMSGVTPEIIRAVIINTGQSTQTNVPVSLAITGANTFNTTATITSLPAGDTAFVSFPGFTPTATGTNTLTVSVPADNVASNNIRTSSQIVTAGEISYAQDNPPVHSTALRPLTPNGTLLAKFSVNNTQTVTISTVNLFISFFADNVGKTVYAVIQDAAGNQIGRSPDYIIQTADLSSMKSFTITTPPTLTNTDFYVGIAATPSAVTYFPLGVQSEAPARPNTFYTGPLTGGSVPTPLTSLYRLIIEPVLTSEGADAGVTAITTPAATTCTFTNTQQVCIDIRNTGNTPLTNIPVSYSITGASTQTVNEIFTGTIAPGATANYCFAATANMAAAGSYSITASANTAGDVNTTNNATTRTAGPPAAPTITAGGPTAFCSGGSVALTAATTTTGVTYQWRLNGTPIAGATLPSFIASASGSYTVVALAGSCQSPASAATTITINLAPATPTITPGGSTNLCTGGSVTLTAASATAGATFQWMLNGSAVTGATSATFTANAAGSYSVVATANGCTSTSSATSVTLNSTPATPTITANGPTTFCTGSAVMLTAASTTPGVTFQWSANGTPVPGATSATLTATAPGNYTVAVTSTGNCTASSSATAVTVNPKPATPVITKSVNTLSSSATTGSYQWYSVSGTTLTPVPGATSQTFTPTANGDYTVIVTVNGCESDAAATMNIVLGIASLAPGMEVSVYPNPTGGKFEVKLTGFEKEASFQIINITGQAVVTEIVTITSGTAFKDFDLGGMAKGVYILKVTSGNNLTYRKVILD